MALVGWSYQIFLLIGLLCVVTESTEDNSKVVCQEGWVQLHRGCYKFVIEEASWTDALGNCKAESSELVTILSSSEKEALLNHLMMLHPEISSWWVGLNREESSGTNWKWIDGEPVISVTPWIQQRFATRPGEYSGVVEIKTNTLYISSRLRSSLMAYICEFHSISQRPDDPTTPIQPPEPITTEPYVADDSATQSPEVTPQTVTAEVRPCAQDTDGGSMDYGRIIKRLHSIDDPLYREYLQSEINANDAKVVYYQRVATAYEAALQQQNEYYERSKEKLRAEIDNLGKAPICT